MNKFKLLMLPLAGIMWFGTTLFFVNVSRDIYGEFQEEKLDAVVNYATDAAVDELVENTIDLNMDYTSYDETVVDPQIALDMFSTVYLKGMGLPCTDDNYANVETNYLKTFCVAAYDGFYIAEPRESQVVKKGYTHDGYASVFTMKHPYLYTDSSGNMYALNLGFGKCMSLGVSGGSSVVAESDSGLNKTEQLSIINDLVSDALMYSVYEQTNTNGYSTIYVPSGMTDIVRTNAVDRVTVMAYMSDIPLGFGTSYDTFGIGGSRVERARPVVGYRKPGSDVKYYMYADKYYEIYGEDSYGDLSSNETIELFETPIDAASKGYHFDFAYYQ